ncbi:MAG TPA: cell envelope integrity protein TolA [Steroidobacteraceae bacterium]|nr:cell envelope integrity protein TolA [Steroidobacteraceae bacterium]
MPEFFRQHWTYLIGALLLHVLFAGVFALTLISMQRHAPPPQLAIQAIVVDRSQLARAPKQQKPAPPQEDQAQKEQQAQQEAQRKQQEEQQRRQEQERVERERQVELKQREDEQRRQEQERQAREQAERQKQVEAERQRKADAERKRVEEIERKQKEEAAKRKAAEEARAQKAREADLQRQLEEEEGRTEVANSGLLNQYVAMIEQRIVRNWNRPPSARPGLECEVRVTQTPGGTVLSVQLGKCNGDAAVQQSIETAVMRSSPLPPPPDPRLFERTLVLIFKPAE